MSKYKAVKVTLDNHKFDSKREAKRYSELRLLERLGQIRNLELQPAFPLIVNGVKVCEYRGDFVYFEGEKRVIEDSKGFKTRDYRIKRKLLLALNPGMDHREV